jgi:hypothetical protein
MEQFQGSVASRKSKTPTTKVMAGDGIYRVVSQRDTEPGAPEGRRFLAIHQVHYVRGEWGEAYVSVWRASERRSAVDYGFRIISLLKQDSPQHYRGLKAYNMLQRGHPLISRGALSVAVGPIPVDPQGEHHEVDPDQGADPEQEPRQ